jgi:PAS domain S-box-containing protein
MKDKAKTKQVLIQELVSLRQRITELEQSESECKRVDDLLRLRSEILENMVEGVHLARVDDGVIIYANSRFESMFGYDPGELVGKHVSIVNAPGVKSPEDVASEIIRSLEQTGVWNGEVNNIRKDGTTFWCYANVSKFKHPQNDEVWISVHQNITERKKAEEALRSERDNLDAIMRSSPVGLLVIDEQELVASANPAAERLFCRKLSDLQLCRCGDFIGCINRRENGRHLAPLQRRRSSAERSPPRHRGAP